MINAIKSKHFEIILRAIFAGSVIGFLSGLAPSIINITAHSYFENELYNLALIDLQHNLTDYTVFFIICSLLALAAVLIIKWAYHRATLNEEVSESASKKKINALILFVILIFVYGAVCTLYYSEVFTFPGKSTLGRWFEGVAQFKSDAHLIFISLLTLSGLILSLLGTYILIKLNTLENVISFLSGILNSEITSTVGMAALGLVITLNIYTFGYARGQIKEGPNIVLISIDTLRTDHLGSYGYGRDTSPNIDKLAERGILFENAYSQAPWTIPSIATMLTSLYPIEHGATNTTRKLSDKATTLIEYMKNNFYSTTAVISNRLLSDKHGLSQGFDTYDTNPIRNARRVSSHSVTDRARKYLSENRENKFFLWLHYMDPHSDYIHHPEYEYNTDYTGVLGERVSSKTINRGIESLNNEDIQHIIDLYDGEIAYTDHSIGKVLDTLDELGLTKNTIIVLTADHGEEFKDRTKIGHGGTVYNELIRVPLIIYSPYEKDLTGHRVKSVVEVRDIPKTIIEVCGIRNTQFGGRNLMSIAEQNNRHNGQIAFSEGSFLRGNGNLNHGIIYDQWKLINNLDDQTFELYDMKNDPGEITNLFESGEPHIDIMRKKLMSGINEFKKQRLVGLEKVEFTENEVKQLKALGYIQ